jgi:branched-chain amino acid transport system ATP-binding protein
MALLQLKNVTKRFGGLIAVDRVSLEVQTGELMAIVGPNGAGKTTLFNVMSGVLVPDAGHIFFAERDITSVPAYKRAPLGIGRTFQIPRPFSAASVRENVAIGAMFGTLARAVTVDDAMAIADHYLQLVGLQMHRDKAAGTLTPVEKKLLEMARALAMKPKLLLLDEAMAGMNPRDIDQIVALLKRLKHEEEHMSIIAMVEHIMRAVVGLAERVIVMHQGATLVDAPTAEALRDPRVVEVYLGPPKRA